MSIREELENIEEQTLSPYACLSKNSQGRAVFEEPCAYRTCFMRDRDRIIHSKSFRRLKHKTQVFIIPEDDHFRTRLTHTLEVAQIARTIAKGLRLNEDLTEAIALGHDLGHTPFGHAGESVLNEILTDGFEHCKQSVRIVELIEKEGKGLNLTKEVLDGILNHRTAGNPFTLEGKIVRLSDKIAYINHDIDDAIRAHLMKEAYLPTEATDVLGNSIRKRIDTIVTNIINMSKDKNDILMSPEIKKAMSLIREWMFMNMYSHWVAEKEVEKAKSIIYALYSYYKKNINEMPYLYKWLISNGEKEEQVVADYISGMTDDYAVSTYEKLFIPTCWALKK